MNSVAILFGFLTIALGFGFLSALNQTTLLKREAVVRGVAEYNSTNGAWQWKAGTYDMGNNTLQFKLNAPTH